MIAAETMIGIQIVSYSEDRKPENSVKASTDKVLFNIFNNYPNTPLIITALQKHIKYKRPFLNISYV